jgi:hypothetical protein
MGWATRASSLPAMCSRNEAILRCTSLSGNALCRSHLSDTLRHHGCPYHWYASPMSSAHWLQKLGLERILVSNVSATAGGCSMSLRPSLPFPTDDALVHPRPYQSRAGGKPWTRLCPPSPQSLPRPKVNCRGSANAAVGHLNMPNQTTVSDRPTKTERTELLVPVSGSTIWSLVWCRDATVHFGDVPVPPPREAFGTGPRGDCDQTATVLTLC